MWAAAAAVCCSSVALYLLWRRMSRHRDDDDLFSHEASSKKVSTVQPAGHPKTPQHREGLPELMRNDTLGTCDVEEAAVSATTLKRRLVDPDRVERRLVAAAKRSAALDFAEQLLRDRHVSVEEADEDGEDDDSSGSYKTDPALEYRIGLTMESIMRDEIMEVVDSLTQLQAKAATAPASDFKLHQKVRKTENKLLEKAAVYLKSSKALSELAEKHGGKIYDDIGDEDARRTAAEGGARDWQGYRPVSTRDNVFQRPSALNGSQAQNFYGDELDEDDEEEALDEVTRRQLMKKRRQQLAWADGNFDDEEFGHGGMMDDDDDDYDEDGDEWLMDEDDDDEYGDEFLDGEEMEEDEDALDPENLDVGQAELNREMFESQLVEHLLRIREGSKGGAAASDSVRSVHSDVMRQVDEETAAMAFAAAHRDEEDDDNWADDEEDEEEQEAEVVPVVVAKRSAKSGNRRRPWVDH